MKRGVDAARVEFYQGHRAVVPLRVCVCSTNKKRELIEMQFKMRKLVCTCVCVRVCAHNANALGNFKI